MIKMEQRMPSIPDQRSEDTEAVPDIHSGLPDVTVKMENEEDDPWISNHQGSEESNAFPGAHSGLPEEMTEVKDEEELWDHQAVEGNNTFTITCSGFPGAKPDLVPQDKQGERPWIREQNTCGKNEAPEHTSEFPVVKVKVEGEEEALASDVQDFEEEEVHAPGHHFEAPFRTTCSREYSMMPSKKTKSMGVRGISWKEKETLDLLSIWGEAKVQEALRASHRNLDSFERISREMMTRGHNRTAEECRTKTKTMRMEYRRVVAHNNQSGNNPVTCPFYAELHRILRGDASVKPRRIVRGLKCQNPARPTAIPLEPLQQGSEELSTHELLTINPGNIGDPSTGSTGEDPPGGEPSGIHGGTPAQSMGEAAPSEGSEVDAPLTPNTRLAKSRTKKRQASGLYSVAERMMAHSTQLLERELEARRREHEMEMEERRREREEDNAHWEREQASREHMIAAAHQDRQLIREALQRNLTMLESAVEAFRMLVALRQPPSTSSTGVGQGTMLSVAQTSTEFAGPSVPLEAAHPPRKRRATRQKETYSP